MPLGMESDCSLTDWPLNCLSWRISPARSDRSDLKSSYSDDLSQILQCRSMHGILASDRRP